MKKMDIEITVQMFNKRHEDLLRAFAGAVAKIGLQKVNVAYEDFEIIGFMEMDNNIYLQFEADHVSYDLGISVNSLDGITLFRYWIMVEDGCGIKQLTQDILHTREIPKFMIPKAIE